MIGLQNQTNLSGTRRASGWSGDNYSERYLKFISSYSRTKRPVAVDFRKLVPFHSGIDRYSHLLHFYPAKLLLNIPYFFLNCDVLTKSCKNVLDPFCGSGTVLLESILSGRNAFGADANPLARLISKAKTTPLSNVAVGRALRRIVQRAKDEPQLTRMPQSLLDWNHWYSKKVFKQLSQLSYHIGKTRNADTRAFFELCLSQTTRKVSLADPKISVPVRLNPNKDNLPDALREHTQLLLESASEADAIEIFQRIAKGNLQRLERLKSVDRLGSVAPLMNNAMHLDEIDSCSIDLIITSPPYAGAQKYIRSTSHSIGWLQLSPDETLRTLEKLNIGREHYSKSEYSVEQEIDINGLTPQLKRIRNKNPLRAHIVSNYLTEMQQCLQECYRVLRSGGIFVLIIGNNVVCGESFNTRNYLKKISENLGFSVELILRDDINSRGLMTKRNKTASVISCEWILILKKP